MKKTLLILLSLTAVNALLAQTTTSEVFHSEILNEDRNIRIHLPKSFDSADDVQYPLTLVFDGEYLFYSIMGVTEVLTTREIMPESIVVGIDQNDIVNEANSARWIDCSYNYKSGEMDETGLKFKAFIETELVPFLTEKYKVGKFKTIAGHSFTANYINYFLDGSLFSGFIAISPYIPESVEEHIAKSIAKADRNIYYYLCTGADDLSGHIRQIKRQDSIIFSQSQNPKFKYLFKDYKGESHMSLTVRGVSDALSQMYSDFSPIYTLNPESIMAEEDLISYLTKRYENIEATYGISEPFREDDLTSISWIIEEQENWDALAEIGQIELDLFPESIYGYYMIALAEENRNNLPRALEYYKLGYAKLGDEVSNKSDFYQDIERLEKLMDE